MTKFQRMREDLGLKRSEFGYIFNVTGQTIAHWERGISNPTLKRKIKIAKFFNIPFIEVNELFKEDVDTKENE